MYLLDLIIEQLVDNLKQEDDILYDLLANKNDLASCNFISRSSGVVSGLDVAKKVFKTINPKIGFEMVKNNGDYINRGDVLAVISGPVCDILRGEKLALNFVRYLSGIASLTNKYKLELVNTDASLVYSGNANPIYESLVIEAFNHGGGITEVKKEYTLLSANFLARFDTFDDAIKQVKAVNNHNKVCLEVRDLEEFEEAIISNANGVRLITIKDDLFNNISSIANTRKRLEVFGNIDLKKIRGIALKGFEYFYIPQLTDNAVSFPIDMCFYKKYRKIKK